MNSIDISKIKPRSVPLSKEKAGWTEMLQKDISFLKKTSLGDTRKERFYSELSVLLSAGVDLRTSLDLVIAGQKKESEKQLFIQLRDAVVQGSSLSTAMNKSGKFSTYEEFSIRIGEESGRINEILTELTAYYGRVVKQKRQIINALSYPTMVMLTAIGTIMFMLGFIVPLFRDVFKRFGGELPAITQMVLKVSDMVKASYGWFFLFVFVGVLILFLNRKSLWWKKTKATILMKLPVFGGIITRIYLARFCTSMHLLLSARTPLVNALELVKNMVTFYPMEVSLDAIREDVLRGKSLNESLAKFALYPAQLISLIQVGEEVNKLEQIFGKLSKQYSDEVDYRTETLRSLIEPLLIIFIGTFVALILIAMYLPLFKLGSTMH